MKSIKGLFAIAAAATLSLSLAACGGTDTPASDDATATTDPGTTETEETTDPDAATGDLKIGIALPQKTSQNWVEAEGMFTENCESSGVECIIQFANSGAAEQQNQIATMIENGVNALIIGAVDGSQLGTQLAQAKAAGIPIIAYDRLLTNTTDIDYYIAYDNFQVGELQGQALLEGLEKIKTGKDKWTIELIAGSPDDANSLKFFDGAMSVLTPKIDDGTLSIPSGQKEFNQVSTQGWDPKNVQTRMDTILSANYSGDDVMDGVLSPNDTLGRAAITSVEQAGKDLPVVTGQDSEDESVTWVTQGKQYSTIYKDTRTLVEASLALAIDAASGNDAPDVAGATINDTDYESQEGNPVVSYLLTPQIVTADNAADVYANDETRLELVKKAQE